MNILISGAGVAGPVVAYWLLRADPSHTITILERAPSLRSSGQSIDIRQSAVDIIKAMGVEPAIKASTTREEGIRFVDDDGESVAEFPATGDAAAQGMTSEYEILRGDLVEILFDLVKDKVDVRYGCSVESLDEREDGVRVGYTGGEGVYDLVVACDGQSSRVRKLALGGEDRARWRSFYQYIGYFTVPEDLLRGSNTAAWYNDTGGRIIFLRPDPEAGKCRAVIGRQCLPSDPVNETYRAALQSNDLRALLRKEFASAGWLSKDVLAHLDADDFYASETAQIRCSTLVAGRVALVGDAGFCPTALTGMGTSLAIIGAYILAGELSRASVPDALKRYNDTMLPFSRSVQGVPAWLPRLVNPQSRLGVLVVRTVLRVVWYLGVVNWVTWFSGAEAFKKKSFQPPRYQWSSERA